MYYIFHSLIGQYKCVKQSQNKFLSVVGILTVFTEKQVEPKANKIHDDEFQKIKKSDVIFLSETHTCYSDILLYDGYKSFMNCHSMDSSKKRGGLVVFIKRNILSGITLVDKSSQVQKKCGLIKAE